MATTEETTKKADSPPKRATARRGSHDKWGAKVMDAGRKPFPKKADLAFRLGLSDRQVQRYIAELETAGFVRRIERTAAHRGKISNEYDLGGLVQKLAALEPEFREVADEARAARGAVARPGFRTRGKTKPAQDA